MRCVFTLPVHKSPAHASTIGYYSLGSGVRARLVGLVTSLKIPYLQRLLAYRRRRILQRFGRAELVDEPFVEMPSRL